MYIRLKNKKLHGQILFCFVFRECHYSPSLQPLKLAKFIIWLNFCDLRSLKRLIRLSVRESAELERDKLK